jgi:PAS domain S-box-containing protein
MLTFLSHNRDYAIFAGVALVAFAILAWALARSRKGARLPGYIWLLTGLILVAGWWRVQEADDEQRDEIVRLVRAMAPTYAREMARNGHAQLTLETKPDDPLYQKLRKMEDEWMGDNPSAHDIYTMRLLPDGKKVFIVDSDTDYNHDGTVAENEEGAALGDAYEEVDEGLDEAFRGHANFDFEPITDKWGTWVGAWTPIYGADGKLEAVLGIDYDAGEWLSAIASARRERIVQLALFLATIGAAGWAIGALRADLARREAIEEGLRQSQERWNLTVEQMPLAFTEWDPQGKIIGWNPAAERIFGYSASEVRGKGLDLIVPPSAREHVDQIWRELLQRSGGVHGTNENLTREGRLITCEWFNTPVTDRQGNVISILSLAQDITQRLSLEQQILQSHKMQAIGLLAAGIAHDFNNILTIIQGHAELLLGQEDLPAVGREDVERIAIAAERAANLTRQLLTFSRRQAMFARPVQLNQVMAGASEMLGRVLGADIRLHCEFAPALPTVEADPSMLDQIITNLAVNARDAMPKGGVLTLATRLAEIREETTARHPEAWLGPAVCLRVSDTGCGIPAEKLPHIFEPFFTTKEVGKGTGLGLAAVHGIVKQHRGWIEIASEVGRGTTVEIFFPPCSQPAAAEAEAPTRAMTPPRVPEAERISVLVVEDEGPVREIVIKTLERSGYRVFAAQDGPSAQAVWAREKKHIDLLFTDMVMPNGLNGRDLAGMFRAERPGLRVIYSSGYSVRVAMPGFLENDTDIFLQKPYVPAELLATVNRALGLGSHLSASE